VLTQRPFWPVPPAGESDPNDPRLQDAAFLDELEWAKEQIEASGCVCCHDSRQNDGQVGQWDISHEPIWLDTISDSGLALFAGFADSSVLGAYPPEQNHGFDRTATGIPTTDTERMRAFVVAELTRRGITEDEARAVAPFGGPIYTNQVAVPQACGEGVGIDQNGIVHWTGGDARYLYVMEQSSKNPGVPPNLDLPEGTLFRLDVLASQEPIESGVQYGTAPEGAFQRVPTSGEAPELERDTRYHLTVLRDVGVPIANCIVTFGDAVSTPELDAAVDDRDASADPDASVPDTCTGANADDQGFGAPCTTDAQCTCAADYCALMPGQATGYCTFTGCVEDASVCPTDSSCFDVSIFQPGAPAICLLP
jgi:hypothetical protein